MNSEVIVSRALLLAEEFLARAQSEVLDLAEHDLDRLRDSATALRTAASDRSSEAKTAERVAYLVIASAFNQLLAARKSENGR